MARKSERNSKLLNTSVPGSSWVSEQTAPFPLQRRTCSRCSAASGPRSPRAGYYRCSGWPPPGILVSYIHYVRKQTQCMCREYMLTHQVQWTISWATLYYAVKFKMHILKSWSSAGRYSPKRKPLHRSKRRVPQHNWSHGRKGNDVSVPSKEMGTREVIQRINTEQVKINWMCTYLEWKSQGRLIHSKTSCM